MQKQERKGFVNFIKRTFNVRQWSDADRVKSYGQYIMSTLKTFFVPHQSTTTESFEDAQKRLKLSDDALIKRRRALFQLTIFMVVMTVSLFVYAIYQVVYGSFHGFLMTISLTSLAMVMAFRYHFWYFQIKERKLGCTLREWFKYGLLGGKR